MTLRLGLIGHGRWGRNIARTLMSFPDVSLSIVPKGAPPEKFDGVLVATQSATHAEAALPYIEAGVPTFIEKPMAITVADAERLKAAATRTGAAIFVGHMYLYHPAFLAALKLLPTLGAVRRVICEGMNNSPRTDSSVLWDWLPHDLAMAHAIFGRNPNAVTTRSLSKTSVPQAAISRFQYGDTPMISTVSWISHLPRKRLVAVCDNGTLVFDDKAERKLTLHGPNGEISHPGYSGDPPLTRELEAFLQRVRSGKPDASQIAIGVDIVRAIAAAEKSLGLGGQRVAI